MNYTIKILGLVIIILGSFIIYENYDYHDDSLLLGSALIMVGIAVLLIDILLAIDSKKKV